MNKYLINKLINHGSYEGKPVNGKLIETHISWVILTKRYAFKIKKEMQYSFLDFSTLDKRKFYCERELVLNKRFSDIYLDVLPIKLDNNKLHIGNGKGKIIEFAVRMKRLQTAKQMNHLLERDCVSNEQIKVLAKKIAVFHLRTKIIHTPFNKIQAKNIFNDILSITDWVKLNYGKKYADQIKKAILYSNSYLDLNEQFIANRVEEGFCRDCHGDLHSKNIFLYKDPIIFDCIEFNDDFRQIDVLNELAFFCMDLEAYERWDLSKQFMESYLELFPCMMGMKGEQLFKYFKCYRASVRAKVNTLRAMQADNEYDENKYNIEVKKYLKLMANYMDE